MIMPKNSTRQSALEFLDVLERELKQLPVPLVPDGA
jgi:hypothetical protein